jgi:hypothetical protein
MLNKEIKEDKFTFTHTDFDGKEYIMALHGEKTVNQLLEYFLMFMKGCGYQFRLNDRLELIDGDEEMSSKDTDHFVPLDNVVETASEKEQREMQEILERWKQKELEKTNYVSTTAFDDQFRSDPTVDAEDPNAPFTVKSEISLDQLNDTIIPFLESLKLDPEKSMIHWPNRAEVVDDQIQKIKDIIGDNNAS